MSWVRRLLSVPHLILALVVTGAAVGVLAFFSLPVNLFPDSERPQAAIITVWPGASAQDVEAAVTRPIETELAGSDLLRQVLSTSRDEVSSVIGEFRYEKDLDTAAADAASALDRVRGRLPPDVRPPMVFKISSATPAVMTLALSPMDGAPLDLGMVRQIAENEMRDRLLEVPEVARVEVFGGHRPLALVEPDPTRLAAHDLTIEELATALSGRARNQPFGWLRGERRDELLVRLDARSTVEELVSVPVAARGGRTLRLGDLATVRRGEEEPTAFYHGNGEPAIALAIQRSASGHALETIEAVERVLPELERDHPSIRFQVPDDQGRIIRLSMDNMKKALVGAILPTMLILYLFLGDRRITLLSGVSLPLTFLLTFAAMWGLGLELNLVTLTAIIVAVGMLVDNSVVVIENIARHGERADGRDGGSAEPREIAADGASEVALAILGGTVTTIMVLVPILFVGGFVETILRPFATTLILAIASSYLVAVSVIPLLAPALVRRSMVPSTGRGDRRGRLDRVDRAAGRVGTAVTHRVAAVAERASGWALRHRGWTMLLAVLLFVGAARQVPVLGRNLMPPMDTGIVKVSFEAASNMPLDELEGLLGEMERTILAHPEVVRLSSAVGSEPAVTAFGAASTPRQGLITVDLVDRFHREESIWELEERLDRELRRLPGLVNLSVFEYGSTPFSTIKASVDVEVRGPDPERLEAIGRAVEERLRRRVRGLTSVGLSWRRDTLQQVFEIDAARAARHGTTPEAVALQLAGLLRGRPATELRLPAQRGLPVSVQLAEEERAAVDRLAGLEVVTRPGRGPGGVPLGALGTFRPELSSSLVTHRNLVRTLDVTATRGLVTITHLQEDVEAALEDLELPRGYEIRHQGEISAMREAFGRLGGALLLSLFFLYGVLVPTFRSWTHPLTILAAVPLAAVGGIIALLLAYKSANMPAFMGIILLGGVAVNTSILVLDFMERGRREGMARAEAIREAIRRRTRPILMTTFSTVVGMLPIALERAVGLERLSPLAIVAIGGLLVSAFLVLVYVPVVATLLEDGVALLRTAPDRVRRRLAGRRDRGSSGGNG